MTLHSRKTLRHKMNGTLEFVYAMGGTYQKRSDACVCPRGSPSQACPCQQSGGNPRHEPARQRPGPWRHDGVRSLTFDGSHDENRRPLRRDGEGRAGHAVEQGGLDETRIEHGHADVVPPASARSPSR